jgi:hypothetical protein
LNVHLGLHPLRLRRAAIRSKLAEIVLGVCYRFDLTMRHNYWSTFVELIVTPFDLLSMIWGIVPLYFGLLLNEITSGKANYRTAIQTGFSFLWAGAQWIYPYFEKRGSVPRIELGAMLPVNVMVTALVILFGAAALISGLRKKYPKGCTFLGQSRFSNYFMIMIFPIQAQVLHWTWERLIALILFAPPVWVVLHFGLRPLRNRN